MKSYQEIHQEAFGSVPQLPTRYFDGDLAFKRKSWKGIIAECAQGVFELALLCAVCLAVYCAFAIWVV